MFQPRLVPGLAITVDYFDISIDDTITTFQAPNTWTACYANNDPAACARINRNPNGQLWVGNGYVQDLNINIGRCRRPAMTSTSVIPGSRWAASAACPST